jgi:hypothetical protein
VSDESVRAALRSDASLVVVEAPAGCGKTHQGADYAREIAGSDGKQRLLILTHTNAACSVFAERTASIGLHVEIRTNDSLIAGIAGAYHEGLGLAADVTAWVREQKEGHAQVALKVAQLLTRYPMIAAALARRYPTVICDEHQDSSGDQHAIAMALHEQGARLRIFGDPMQKIFAEKALVGSAPPCVWNELAGSADAFELLDTPHGWAEGCPYLGAWTLAAREALKAGGRIDLRGGLPPSVTVVCAESTAYSPMDYKLSGYDRKPIDVFERAQDSLLVVTRHNPTALSLRSFFSRRIPLWEGHMRNDLEKLVAAVRAANGKPDLVAQAAMAFIGEVGKGFSKSAFGDRLLKEIQGRCTGKAKGKSAFVQELARFIITEPNHHGVAKLLVRLEELSESETSFEDVEIDRYREFRDAIRLEEFDDARLGVKELSHRRTYARPKPPRRAISTIHKAKGLECGSVIVIPCTAKTFPDKPDARCLLYVALSRAKERLALVVSTKDPSQLLIL